MDFLTRNGKSFAKCSMRSGGDGSAENPVLLNKCEAKPGDYVRETPFTPFTVSILRINEARREVSGTPSTR